MPKINYVVACWSGPRRFIDPPYIEDRTWYIKHHLTELSKRQHKLAQITVVSNKNDKDDDHFFQEYLASLPDNLNGVPLVVSQRDSNIGQLFGAWSHVYDLYGTSFDYYVLMEDDYVFLHEEFDQVFLNEFTNKTGFVSATTILSVHKSNRPKGMDRVPEHYNVPIYAASGMIKTECMEKIKKRFGGIPYHKTDTYADADQGLLFHAVNNEGYDLRAINRGHMIVNEQFPVKKPPYTKDRYTYVGNNTFPFICSVQYTLS